MDDHVAAKRILSIDDDPEIRELVTEVLSRAGWDVVAAADGPSGLRAAREHCPDLILLDVMMPGMNGYAVCDDLQIDPRTSHVPVVFLTAMNDPRDRARALALGATDYLVKPFDPRTVAECVARNLSVALRFERLAPAREPDATAGSARRAADVPRAVPAGDDFMRFKPFLLGRLPDIDRVRAVVERMQPTDMYSKVASAGVDAAELAACIAEFLGVERTSTIAPDSIAIGVLPAPLCRASLVVPLDTASGLAFAVANPFDRELVETLRGVVRGEPNLIIAEPRTVLSVLSAARTDAAPVAGTSATFTPRAAQPAAPLAILVVDDDCDALAVTVRIAETAGHRVWAAPEGATALVQLARRRFDVVLADIAMPTLGGFALLEIMRAQNIDVPVVFVTGSTSPEDETAAAHMGAVAFVRKPVGREALLFAIDHARLQRSGAPAA
jgi:two-component system phosphate regulon response regulator PhoB